MQKNKEKVVNMKTKQKSKTKKKENLKKLERITHQMKLFHSENWGGSREGAGRKPLYVSDLPRKSVSFYIDEEEKAFLRQQLQKFRVDRAKKASSAFAPTIPDEEIPTTDEFQRNFKPITDKELLPW